MGMIRKLKRMSRKLLVCEAGSVHSLSLAEMKTNNIHSKGYQNVICMWDRTCGHGGLDSRMVDGFSKALYLNEVAVTQV